MVKLMQRLATLSALVLPPLALADLPVHCLRHQLLGEWEFKLGGLTEHRSSCGHQRPDVQEVQPSDLVHTAEVKHVTLHDPNVATTSNDTAGNFTMIYDEAFEVRIEGLTFFAFSRFDLVNGKNTSRCSETGRGWYRDAHRSKWGCYVARKVHQSPQQVSLLSMGPSPAPPTVAYDEPLALDWHRTRVSHLNAQGAPWTARVYHRFVGLSLRQLNSFAGIVRSPAHAANIAAAKAAAAKAANQGRAALLEVGKDTCPEAPPMSRPKAGDVLSRMLMKGQQPPKPCQIRRQAQIYFQPADPVTLAVEKQLPSDHSWVSLSSGRSFVETVMDQGSCGSCYMVSTLRMLTARHRVRTNDTRAEPWSIAFPLHCSEYNQGCKGGYGFLASKWSEDIGLLPASCAPYTTVGGCKVSCDVSKLQKRYRASGHRYIGGFYGASNSAAMMQEMYKNGPIVVSFEPTEDFMFYAGGIFSQQHQGVPAPLHTHSTEWQQVDHAVLATGWGLELGQKYWSVQNSWGETWGEDGYFRIARDINEAGVESIAVAADVVEDEKPEILVDFLAQQSTIHY